MAYLKTREGNDIFYKDWGSGQPVMFCHGWPLNSDSWESQMLHFANNGFRAIAHDRRGHGRSSQPWDGNDMDHYADDLAELIEHLDLTNLILFGFSTGGGEVARYIARHGTARVAKAGLICSVTPLMLQTPSNPYGTPIEVFDGMRANSLANRSQLYLDLASGPFFGFNRAGIERSQGLINSFWMQGVMGGHINTFDSIKAFSETDFREDLTHFSMPTLIIHGSDDQIVPIRPSALESKRLIPHALLQVYNGAPHGLPDTHKQRVNDDMLNFAQL